MDNAGSQYGKWHGKPIPPAQPPLIDHEYEDEEDNKLQHVANVQNVGQLPIFPHLPGELLTKAAQLLLSVSGRRSGVGRGVHAWALG
jgi:hypothetical protein